jgi:hypothetical protein
MNENGFHDHGIYEWGIQTPARHHRIKSYIKYPPFFLINNLHQEDLSQKIE